MKWARTGPRFVRRSLCYPDVPTGRDGLNLGQTAGTAAHPNTGFPACQHRADRVPVALALMLIKGRTIWPPTQLQRPSTESPGAKQWPRDNKTPRKNPTSWRKLG